MLHSKRTTAKNVLSKAMKELLNKKAFQKISVNELCEIAQVSRSTFYANFDDKYQLFSYCMDEAQENFNQLMESHSPTEFFTVMLDFVQNEHTFFYHAFGFSYDEEINEFFYQFFDVQFTKFLNKKIDQGMELPGPLDAVSAFYIGGLTNMVLRWIKSNYKIPKDELATCQYKLLENII